MSEVRTLVASSNSGRFALDDATDGRDLTSGDAIEIMLGGQWIAGRVENARGLYPVEQSLPEIMQKKPMLIARGYYFISNAGDMCGLCVGMKVRLA